MTHQPTPPNHKRHDMVVNTPVPPAFNKGLHASKKNSNKKVFILILFGLILLGGAGFGLYELYSKITEQNIENTNRQRAYAALEQIGLLYYECQEIYEKNEILYPKAKARINQRSRYHESAAEYETRIKQEITLSNNNRKNGITINSISKYRDEAITCYDSGNYERVLKLLEFIKESKASLNQITSVFNTYISY